MPLEVKMAGEGDRDRKAACKRLVILFLHLDADHTVYLLCENSLSCTLNVHFPIHIFYLNKKF